MAKRGVIVRRLNAIENLGSMDVFCTDKTGTLTEGKARLDGALDVEEQPSDAVLRYAALNARFQSGLDNPLDEAIETRAQEAGVDIGDESKVDEIPYDFARKRLSVVVARGEGERTLITKGALQGVLDLCIQARARDGDQPLDAARRAQIIARYDAWGEQGFRVLGLATKEVDIRSQAYTGADEKDLTFQGYLLFFDPPKADVAQAIADLAQRGVQLKIITGDNRHVTRHVAEAVNLPIQGVLTGSELGHMNEDALRNRAQRTTLFTEMDPNQKERIILALQKTGHVVGYMGDGINDASALHAADVGLSVDTAVDVAKDAADFVLLGQGLDILRQGIDEGRSTFANTHQVHPDHHQRQFRQYVQHGRRLDAPALPAAAGPPNPAEQFPVGYPGHHHRQRQRRYRLGGQAAPLEHAVHPQLYGASLGWSARSLIS